MAFYVDLPVYKATWDLLLVIFKLTKNFTRECKYTVGMQQSCGNPVGANPT